MQEFISQEIQETRDAFGLGERGHGSRTIAHQDYHIAIEVSVMHFSAWIMTHEELSTPRYRLARELTLASAGEVLAEFNGEQSLRTAMERYTPELVRARRLHETILLWTINLLPFSSGFRNFLWVLGTDFLARLTPSAPRNES